MTYALYALSAVLIIGGFAGVILPAIPALPLMFAGMALAAWTGDFSQISGWTLTVLGVFALIAIVMENLASIIGAKRAGASKKAILGAAVGTFAGLFFGLWGILLGPFLGAIIGELLHQREVVHAARVGLATWIGLLFGVVLKVATAFMMLGIFCFALIF